MITQSLIFTILYIFSIFCNVSGSVDGVSYLDPIRQRNKVDNPKDDPCNPLYWYPRDIPDYCNKLKDPPLLPPPMPLPPPPPPPPPSPVPIPAYPYPIPLPYPMMPQPMPLPIPLPYGIPIIPTPVLPFPTGIPLPPPPDPCAPPCLVPGPPPPMPGPYYPPPGPPPMPAPMPGSYPPPGPPPMPAPMPGSYPPPGPPPMPAPMPGSYPPPGPPPGPFPISFPFSGPFQPNPSGYVFEPAQKWTPPRVQGMPGVVNKDGGINILPFSDAYSDFIEKHKQKMIRKKLEIFLQDIEKDDRKRRNRYKDRKRHYVN